MNSSDNGDDGDGGMGGDGDGDGDGWQTSLMKLFQFLIFTDKDIIKR